jgi:hypothetical protein
VCETTLGITLPHKISTVSNQGISDFRCVSSHAIHLAEELKSNPLFADLWSKVKDNEAVANRILARTTCSQVTCWCDHFQLMTHATNAWFEN